MRPYDNKYEITIYSSCCNASKGIYYYTTYNNHQINAIDMNKADLNLEKLVRYSLIDKENINYVNWLGSHAYDFFFITFLIIG